MNASRETTSLNTLIRFLIVSVFLAVACYSYSASAPQRPPEEWYGRLRQYVMQKYDLNHDGKLDKKEAAAAKKGLQALRAAMLKKYDVNRDGKLDKEEERKARTDLLTRLAKSFKAHDLNGNGILDPKERATLQADMRAPSGQISP